MDAISFANVTLVGWFANVGTTCQTPAGRPPHGCAVAIAHASSTVRPAEPPNLSTPPVSREADCETTAHGERRSHAEDCAA